MSYKERIVFEYAELSERIALLRSYLESKTASNKTEDELLEKQLDAMLTYRMCLAERIMKMLGE